MKNQRPYIIAENNWRDISSENFDLAVLPWGATEAHNYHLPYATDNIQLEAIAIESASRAWSQGSKVAVLPCVPFGVNTGQLDIPFCININPSTQAAILMDIIHSLETQGIKKVVILNGHGGNNFRQQLRELQAKFGSVFLSTVDWFKIIDPKTIFDNPGDHADEVETSLMMHIAPELVGDLQTTGDGSINPSRIAAIRDGWAWAQRDWLKATNDTGSGDPSMASAEKGEKLLNELSDKLASFYVDLANADINDLYQKN